jgi:hypothetical protein
MKLRSRLVYFCHEEFAMLDDRNSPAGYRSFRLVLKWPVVRGQSVGLCDTKQSGAFANTENSNYLANTPQFIGWIEKAARFTRNWV